MSEENADQSKKFVPPDDGSWIPRERLNEATGKLQSKLSAVEAENQRLQSLLEQSKPVESKKTYSLAELRQFVDDGKITQEGADAIYEQQMEEKFDKKVNAAVTNTLKVSETVGTINSQLKEYMTLVPDAVAEGTKDREKVQKAYDELVEIFGVPEADSVEDRKMQLAALSRAFGPISSLKVAKNDLTRQERETQQDQMSQGDYGQVPQGDIPKGLNQKQIKHYSKQIENGIYKDWAEVKEELKYAR